MAHSLSSKKRIRQNVKRNIANRGRRSALRTRLRAFKDAVVGGDVSSAEGKYRDACKLLDREANLGLIHRNQAARRKSRMAGRLSVLKSKASS